MDWELIKYTIASIIGMTLVRWIIDHWIYINIVKKMGSAFLDYTMYKNGVEDDKKFLKEMETLCLKAREGVNRNYKSNIISLEQSMEMKSEIDELRENLRHGPRGKLQKLGRRKRKKLVKLDSTGIKLIEDMISDLESKNNQNLTSNFSKLIKETNDALTRRTHLVAYTGD